MKRTLPRILGRVLIAAFLLVLVVGPVCLYAILRLGWPPVIGNLSVTKLESN